MRQYCTEANSVPLQYCALHYCRSASGDPLKANVYYRIHIVDVEYLIPKGKS